ncbi:hypothetical protein [Streptomyces sp. AC495_CC817]|uniref:hypothetical protein n=1 Tax=Streptomyces sp. AC495_CC817 TaxID=2823900 RepID=UPI001C27035E|nr:hypothetical protein [Streptomyces sp. AC495_CC817]
MKIEKRGFKTNLGLEMYAAITPGAPERRSHAIPVTPTEQQVAEHARAKLALEELESNSFVSWPRMDDEITIMDLPTEKVVFDETHEEFAKRLQAWWAERGS